ncbi:MAG: sigma 54-interacting transcriptional regulator [bacterium]
MRLVRYVASRLRQEYPTCFLRLDSAIAWWTHSTRESTAPPDDVLEDVRLLHAISEVVQAALDGESVTHSWSTLAAGHSAMRESGFLYKAKEEFPDVDWEKIFADVLLRERGYLYPSEKAQRIPNEDALKALQGTSFAWRDVMQKIRAAAAEEVTTLFVGETGTGKSFNAEIVHWAGPRRNQPLLTLHCERVTAQTIDQEVVKLFNEAGIAVETPSPLSLFKFQGTLLLEEIGTLPAKLQSLVLEGIESIEKERAQKGSEGVFPRLMITTTRPLEQVHIEGSFRQDLLYRIAVFQVDLPPLRQRKDDIALLAQNILVQLADKHQVMTPRLEKDAIRKLERHSWPGNIRELRNILETGLLQAKDRIGKEHLDFDRSPVSSVFSAKDTTMELVLERLERLGVHVSKGNPEVFVQFLRYTIGRRFRTHELAEDLNIASSTARAYVHRLVEAGMIRKFGEKKGTTYQVIESELFQE